MSLTITFSATREVLVELKWMIFKKYAHTFDSKNSMTEVLKIDSSQIIWVQVLCQFFHLKEKIIKYMLSLLHHLLLSWSISSTEDPKWKNTINVHFKWPTNCSARRNHVLYLDYLVLSKVLTLIKTAAGTHLYSPMWICDLASHLRAGC